MLKLVIEDDEGRKTVVPFVREEITIGRQEGNTIRLTERNVSRRHARLVRNNGSVLVEDLGSYNGIRINGERIQGQVPVADGDLIQIGDYDLAIQHEASHNAPPPTPSDDELDREDTAPSSHRHNGALASHSPHGHASTAGPGGPQFKATQAQVDPDEPPEAEAEPATDGDGDELDSDVRAGAEDSRRLATSVIRVDEVEANRPRRLVDIDAQDAPRLVVLNTDLSGREFACVRSELKIGRTDDNDIAIDHRSLSRTHAKLVREDNGDWRVIDLQSANGLTVNGESYAQATLRSGDVVELGHLKLKFVGAGENYQFVADSDEGPAGAPKWVPIVAGLVVVVLLGGGALWYTRTHDGGSGDPQVVDPVQPADQDPPNVVAPPDDPPVKVEPTANVDPPVKVEPAAPPEPTVEEKMAAARASIEEGNWPKAIELLNSCKTEEGTLHPDAKELLGQLKTEKDLRALLDKAEKALKAGRLEEARTLLENSEKTKLQRVRHAELRAKLQTALDEKAAQRPPVVPVVKKPPPEATPVKSPGGASPAQEAQKLYEEGQLLLRSKQLREARAVLEKCLKADPTFAVCHKLLGSANAKLGDAEKGSYHYRKFLQLAPNDKDADKVRNILETYEGTKK